MKAELALIIPIRKLSAACFALMIILAALPEVAQAGRPYYSLAAVAFNRKIDYSVAVSRDELKRLGFDNLSGPNAWEQVAVNADSIVFVTSVPLSSKKTYVQVIATSNTEASAKRWRSQIMEAIQRPHITIIDS
jgi:hypothetical protein